MLYNAIDFTTNFVTQTKFAQIVNAQWRIEEGLVEWREDDVKKWKEYGRNLKIKLAKTCVWEKPSAYLHVYHLMS